MHLSVIIPTHNRSAMLGEAIRSVISQPITALEIIVCDDGSTEEMAESRNLALGGGRRLIWSRSEECLGAQVARNRGVALARGEAVLFLDSDDVLAADGIPPLLQALEADPALDYAYGKVILTDERLTPLAGSPPVGEPFTAAPVDVAGYHWHTMGAIYRKAYLEKVGPWNEALTGSQDREYQARVKLAGGRGQFVDTVTGYWRQHGGSRVGTNAFRPDYVRSVMLTCDSILQTARKVGRCDRALERRLAKTLILHALEWGANHCRAERQRCFDQAADSLADDVCFKAGIKWMQLSPAFMDAWLRKMFVRLGKSKTVRTPHPGI